MSPREQWSPTPDERAEYEARHAQACRDHKAAHPDWYITEPTDKDLLS